MIVAYGDRVRQTTQSTGTGNLNLDAQPDIRWRTFAAEIGSADFIRYQIEVDGTSQWENGFAQIVTGTPDVLVRYLVTKTSAGNTLPIDLPAGNHQVTSGIDAGYFEDRDITIRNQITAGDYHYEPSNGFNIDPGSATIDGLFHIWTGAIAGPGATGHTPNTLHYVYLYNVAPGNQVPAVEVSTTAPALDPAQRYWAKGADATRRLFGMFRADAAGAVHVFFAIRNDAELTIYYDQNADTQIFDGQSLAAWSSVTNFAQFAGPGVFEARLSVSMLFSNQNNANRIGLNPTDNGTDPVDSGIYRQVFNASKDAAVIEDSNLIIPMLKDAPALWTRNENLNGTTDYQITIDSVSVNLRP